MVTMHDAVAAEAVKDWLDITSIFSTEPPPPYSVSYKWFRVPPSDIEGVTNHIHDEQRCRRDIWTT